MMRHMRAAALGAALLIGSTVSVDAQGGPPGGGMRRAPDEMALLAKTLEGVSGITDAQAWSLAALETGYKPKFITASSAMRDAIVAARQAGGPPDMAVMMKMRGQMDGMRKEELAAARAILTSAQHPKFDENVKGITAADSVRDAQMRERMGGRPPE